MTSKRVGKFAAWAGVWAAVTGHAVAGAQPPTPAMASPERAPIQFNAAAFGAYVEQQRQEWKVPGLAVAVVRGNELLLMDGYGLRQVGKSAPVDTQTVFNIGSVTKSFTAALLADLSEDNKLALGDKVSAHLPDVISGEHARDITIMDLLSHRSGLATANYSIMGDISRDEMLQRIRYLPRAAPLRTNFVYNNFGYVVAAAAAEKATGSTWDELIRERLFTPIGMTEAVTSTAEEQRAANRAMPHGLIGGRATTIRPMPLRMVSPAGAMGMSIRDLARWVQLHLNGGMVGDNQLLAPETVRMMQAAHVSQPVTPGLRAMWPSTHFRAYGLGWFMRDYRGIKLLEHGGNTSGYTAHVAFVPELDFGIAVMTNMSNSPLPTALIYRAIDLALGDPVRDWSAEFAASNTPAPAKTEPAAPPATPALPLASYAGSYRSALYGEARISWRGDRLVLHITDQLTGDLTAKGPNTFSAKWRDPYLAAVGADGPFVFEAGADGRPGSLILDLPGEKVVYTRVAGGAAASR